MKAEKTLAAIDAAITTDGGARFRVLQKEEFAKLTDAFSPKEDTFRNHLGASVIGRHCAREIWYSWHWAARPNFEPRILRLFNRGHLEEARFSALLRLLPVNLWTTGEDGNQLRIGGCGGHFGGSLDGVVQGIPDAPETPLLVEYKTHGTKSFTALSKDGVRETKWEHYVQMQCYMHAHSLTAALYLAVNKDTDDLYGELIYYEKETAERYLQRAQSIIDSPEPPTRINSSPSWFQCRFCSYTKMCHDFAFPEVNCRTCAHSTPKEGGWYCEHKAAGIPKSCEACPDFIYNPTMLNGITVIETNQKENWMRYRLKDGSIKDSREL